MNALVPTGRNWTLRHDARPPTHNAARRRHWTTDNAATAEWRDAYAWLARAERIPRLSAVEITARPHVRDRRSLPDVAACYPAVKAAVDGLVLAGVLDDDDPSHHRRLIFDAPLVSGFDALELIITEVRP